MISSARNTLLSILAVIALFGGLYYADNNLDSYKIQILNLIAINAILAVSLNLIYGFTGMFSLGHAGFMAIGAYVCAILILSPTQKENMWILEPILPVLQNLSVPFVWAVVIGGLIAAVFGLLIAIPVLRLGGDYLGIATLGFAEIIRVVITNASPLTNGSLGIKGIPQYATLWWNYGWLVLTLYVIVTLLRSNVGNIFRAIREDEIASRVMGVNTLYYRVLSFTIGAFFAGVGGALMAALISTIDPKMFNFLLTFNVLMFVVAGGLGSITGSVIGSIIITFMLEWLRVVEGTFNPFLWEVGGKPIALNIFGYDLTAIQVQGIPGMRMVIFSLMLMFIILFWRRGLMGQREFSWDAVFAFPAKMACLCRKVAGRKQGGKI